MISPVLVQPTPRTILLRIALLALAARIGLELVGLASQHMHDLAVWENALSLWNQWDAPHYLRIAEVGYVPWDVPGDDRLFIVFFPLYPMAVMIVAFVVRDLVAAGMLVSYLGCVGGAWLLYRLMRLDSDHNEAWRAVLLLFAFPTAYFLAAPYTEALFLFAVLGSVYAARTQAWPVAALGGALATGTRLAGVALAPALIAEALSARGTPGGKARRIVWVSLSATGLALYFLINWLVYGDPLWFLEVQNLHWSQRAVAPWVPLIDAIGGLDSPSDGHRFIFWGRLSAFVFAVPLLVLATKRLRRPDWLYGWAGFALVLSTSWLISLPRYLLGLYPIFMVLAGLTRSKRVLVPMLVVGACLQAWLFWRFSVGRWTF